MHILACAARGPREPSGFTGSIDFAGMAHSLSRAGYWYWNWALLKRQDIGTLGGRWYLSNNNYGGDYQMENGE